MSAESIPTAAPPWAIKVWADDRNVYAEVPSVNSPCVIAYAYTEGGLARMLALLGAKHTADGGGEPYLRPAVVAKALLKDGLTQRDLDSAREALAGLGLIKGLVK